jgi:hypothetical protein
MSQVVGVGLIFIASTCSSIGMNFQKLAHRQTEYHDPRLMLKPRNQPLNSNVYFRPYMLLGFILTAAAVICDSIALFFIGTTMIGVLGCMAIPINVFVSRYILFEEIKKTEKLYILIITSGCLACLITAKSHEPIETFVRFAKWETAVFITCIWLFAFKLYIITMFVSKQYFQLIVLSVISGIMGAQFVSMGKYLLDIIWLLNNNFQLPPTLQIIGVSILTIMALPLQIIFLNKSLEKFNATHSIAIFQCTWCILNVTQGIIIFGDMQSATTVEYVIFVFGFIMTCLGIIGLSKQIGDEPLSYSDHSPSSSVPL